MKRTTDCGLEWTPVEANGVTFACVIEGHGPLALLMHGFPDTPHTWDDLRPLLVQAGFRVVSPFMRGYAPTSQPADDSYGQQDLGEDVVALIEALGHETAVVVGHDWGASAAYAAAGLAPHKITRLVTLAIPHPAGVKPTLQLAWDARHFVTLKLPGAAQRLCANDFARVRALYKRWSPTWDVPDAELAPIKLAFSKPGCAQSAVKYYRDLSPSPPAALRVRISVPTLCLFGVDDAVNQKMYDDARSRFTGDVTVMETRGGHFLHREFPGEVLSHIVRFVTT